MFYCHKKPRTVKHEVRLPSSYPPQLNGDVFLQEYRPHWYEREM